MKYNELESSTLELKRELSKNDQIIKTVVGFCNHMGGKIVIGVTDDGTIVGFDEQHIQKVLEYLDKAIFEACSPPILPLIYSQRFGNNHVLFIEVSRGMNKPYYVRSEGLEKGTYVRLGRSTLRANADMIEELKWQARGISFDTLAQHHASLDDLSQEKLQAFFSKKVHNDHLLSYHLISHEHGRYLPTAAGLLLFGRDPQRFFPEAIQICTHFHGISGREVIATRDCSGTIDEQLEQAYAFITSELNKSFTITGLRRKETLEIPALAIREMVINAIVHRNYHIKAPIKVAIYENRLEIFSPGSFPGPLNPKNLTMGISYIRNIAICRVFRQMGHIEKLGSGFITLFDSYAKARLPVPQVIEGENYVKCILPRKTARLRGHDAGEDFATQRILKIAEQSFDFSIGDVMQALHMPRASAGRKLKEMMHRGLLNAMGEGRARKYKKA